MGRCDEAIPILRDAFARTRASGDVHDLGRAYTCLSSILLICGQGDESLEVAEAGVAWSRSVGTYGQYGRFLAGNVVEASVDLGRWDEVEPLVDELLDAELFGVNRIGVIGASGTFLVRRGRAADAATLLDEGRALVEPMRDAQFTGPTYLGLAELALTGGDHRRRGSHRRRGARAAGADRR